MCVCLCVLVTQSCPTLCNPMDSSPPGSSVHGILQARILEWIITIPFSRGSSQPRDQTQISCIGRQILYHLNHQGIYIYILVGKELEDICVYVRLWGIWTDHMLKTVCVLLFVIPWTVQSMEFSRPEYWSGWPFRSPGDLPNPGIEPWSPTLQVDSLPAEP